MDFYNGRILVVNLDDGTSESFPLSEEKVMELIGGRGIKSFIEEYGDDALVVGTGVLTCSFFPSSCMGVISWKEGGNIKHLPLNWFFAPEFKLTGFDFLVIKGTSPKLVHLWIRDEICDILDGSSLNGLNIWDVVDKLKREHGDENIHLLVAGEDALSQDYWGGFDSNGCNEIFLRKNLKAIAVRGMGSLFFDEGKFKKFVELMRRAKGEIKEQLFNETLSKKGDLIRFLHRAVSCFNCGLNCNPFLMHRGNPKELKESELEEPGFLVLNPDYIEGSAEKAEDNLKRGHIPVKDDNSIPSSYSSFLKLHRVEIEDEKIFRYLNLGVCPIFMERIFKGDLSVLKDIIGNPREGL